MNFAAFKVKKCLKEIVAIFEDQAKSKGLELKLQLVDETHVPHTIQGDKSKLK